jgi:RimJ/RimL family protein N-acetyltransferase
VPHNEASNNVLRRLGFEDLGIVHLEAFQGEPSQHWRKLLTS